MLTTIPPTLFEKTNMKLKNNSVGKTTSWFCENGMRANHDKYFFVFSLDITMHVTKLCE